jgi:rare lipoprotein A
MKKVSIACVMALAAALVALPLPQVTSTAHASTKVKASWYGPGFHGRTTASGERFNQYAMTAAHRTLPFGTKVRVKHKDRSVIVVINDRGPFIRGRSLDLSKGAARKIGCSGVCLVEMKVLD